MKGTTFTVTVGPEGSSVQVTEGAVQVSTLDGGAAELVRPGAIAMVGASDLYRLNVEGDATKAIRSPNAPAEAGSKDRSFPRSAAYSGPPGQEVRIAKRLDEDSKSLKEVTKGLLEGIRPTTWPRPSSASRPVPPAKKARTPGTGMETTIAARTTSQREAEQTGKAVRGREAERPQQAARGREAERPGQAARGRKPNDPGKPPEGGKPNDPVKPPEGGKPNDPSKPPEGGKPNDPVKPPEGVKPSDPGKPPEDGKPNDPGKPPEDGKPSDPGKPADPGRDNGGKDDGKDD